MGVVSLRFDSTTFSVTTAGESESVGTSEAVSGWLGRGLRRFLMAR
jgi:hypothetical protein